MTEANWQFLKVQVIDSPRSEDAGIIKDKLWGMNSPKFRFLKGKSDTRYHSLIAESMATFLPNGLQLSGFSPTKFQQLYQTKIGLSRWGRQDKFALALSSLD